MQWGQIKLLFILSFLILDLFLLQQFLSKQQQDALGQISTVAEDIETELENADVTIAEGAIPEDVPSIPSLKSKGNAVPEEILAQVEGLDESTQEISIEDQALKVTLDEPVEVTEDTLVGEVSSLVPFSSQYSYWGWNKEEGVALFFQKVNDQTIYFNSGGYLLVTIADGKITGYVATLLTFPEGESIVEDSSQSGEMNRPWSAIENLYDYGLIRSGDEVTSMNIGYHTSYDLGLDVENAPQYFAPTWKVTINGERDLFLYAFTGTVAEVKESSFIEDILNKHQLKPEESLNEDSSTEESNNSETN
ncbi:two-component system regulatory protein YycI [Halobacillus litoralis]|uniref:two-component system regulatory protein YycI n=1 Tax=Halobacillus litoralis TaxID=45668 RepID=UPI001CFF24FF|nr:two-component system regulatory protein YycI [Halobacillus litoralis]